MRRPRTTSPRGAVAGAALARVAAVACLAVGAGPAAAASSVQSGWWSSLGPLAPADAGDALLVQGGPREPAAFAAVAYELEPDEDVVGLTLQVVRGSATTPGATLRACPLVEGFEPGPAQPSEDAPDHDCAQHAESTVSADGRRFEFDLSALGGAEALGVAILPTAPTDRVVLEAPTTDAVQSTIPPAAPSGTPAAPDPTDPPSGSAPVTPPARAGAAPTGTGDVLRSNPAITVPPLRAPADTGPAPAGSPDPAQPARGSGSSDTASLAAPASFAPATVGGSGTSPVAVAGLLLLGGLAAALWLAAGRGGDEAPDGCPAGA